MKLKIKVQIPPQTEEREIDLPSFFKRDDEYVRFYEDGEYVSADKIEIGKEAVSLRVHYPASCWTNIAEKGTAISEQEFLDALKTYDILSADLRDRIIRQTNLLEQAA